MIQLELAEAHLALTAAEKATASGRDVIASQDAEIAQLKEDRANLQRALDEESESSDTSADENDRASKFEVADLQQALADVATKHEDLQQALAAAQRRRSTRVHFGQRQGNGERANSRNNNDSSDSSDSSDGSDSKL
ncbi:hypothetical protein B484DRAFT_395927 [Ochromonadaceae sp. CCMP2298]|nr:hypothetical protein B484DRAFT_395927 [Ochromonadaceae sp. CCMP2298]